MDPFIATKEALLITLKECEQMSLKKRFDKDFYDNLETMKYDVQDLQDTIKIVKSNPSKFQMTDKEIDEREKFVENIRGQLDGLQKSYDSHQRMSKRMDRDKLLQGGTEEPKVKSKFDMLQDSIKQDNDEFIQDQLQIQREVYNKQDEKLDLVIQGTERLQNLVLDMKDEMDEHQFLLEDLTHETEKTGNTLNRVQRRLDKLIKGAGGDKGKILCILLLIIVIAVLLIVLFVV